MTDLAAPGPAHQDLEADEPERAPGNFPVVTLGASAGGLAALEAFFQQVDPRGGAAYVVVTHQHPGHISMLPELLAKQTRLPVELAADGTRLEPDRLYLPRGSAR